MIINTLEVAGIGPAIHAMRNPFDSWAKSDSAHDEVGMVDKGLSNRLALAGPAHAKHLRMIQVWAEVWAPRYWWTEFDTNRMGVEKVSCSTMHTLTARPLTAGDFEWDGEPVELVGIINGLNGLIRQYREAKDADDPGDVERTFRQLKQALPEGFIQRRTVMMSYAALRNMYELRRGHRLREWQQFRTWCEGLPESWMITGV